MPSKTKPQTKAKTKTKKKKTGHGGQVCMKCPSHCCRDLVMAINKPKTKSDINEITSYLFYNTARVFIRNNKWHLIFDGKCIYLSDENFCTIYKNRPPRCRKHMPPNCEKFAPWYDDMINTPEELAEYLGIKVVPGGGA